MRPLAKITILERECNADDFDSESGQGMPDDTEPYEIDYTEIYAAEFEPGDTLAGLIQSVLDNAGCGQWDGGNTGYDPDGSRLNMDGTITERFARIYL